jgi:hypothetical protein
MRPNICIPHSSRQLRTFTSSAAMYKYTAVPTDHRGVARTAVRGTRRELLISALGPAVLYREQSLRPSLLGAHNGIFCQWLSGQGELSGVRAGSVILRLPRSPVSRRPPEVRAGRRPHCLARRSRGGRCCGTASSWCGCGRCLRPQARSSSPAPEGAALRRSSLTPDRATAQTGSDEEEPYKDEKEPCKLVPAPRGRGSIQHTLLTARVPLGALTYGLDGFRESRNPRAAASGRTSHPFTLSCGRQRSFHDSPAGGRMPDAVLPRICSGACPSPRCEPVRAGRQCQPCALLRASHQQYGDVRFWCRPFGSPRPQGRGNMIGFLGRGSIARTRERSATPRRRRRVARSWGCWPCR